MATLQERSGAVNIRVGGNTQENATVVDSLPNDRAVQKEQTAKGTAVRYTTNEQCLIN